MPIEVVIRDAVDDDETVVADLLTQLGHPTAVEVVRVRLREARRLGGRILVAERDSRVVGLLTLHSTPSLHRTPDGRITALVVDEGARDVGVGGALVREAELTCRIWGCGRMEVTSSIDRVAAHEFYERLGYRETRKRFRKQLDPL